MANIFEVFTSGIKKSVAQPASQPGDVFPSGTILQYAGSTPPTNWLFCDGTAVSRTTFATLFGVIGTTYGPGDGSTTFNLPDLRDRVPVGKSGTKALGSTGGLATVSLTAAQNGAHSHGGVSGSNNQDHSHDMAHDHPLQVASSGGAGTTYAFGAAVGTVTDVGGGGAGSPIKMKNGNTGGASAGHTHNISSDGSGTAHENMPPYVAVNHMIKT